jgi:hypothetical protein
MFLSLNPAMRRSRRGAISLLLGVGFLVVLMGVALVLNWAFLAAAYQNFQDQLDAIALSAAPEILDDDVLQDDFTESQGDDLADATATGDAVRQANADLQGARLQIDSADLAYDMRRVIDVTQPATKTNLVTVGRMNTLVVEGLRDPLSNNKLEQLIRGFKNASGNNNAAELNSRALATLDSRVVGFRPTMTMPAPLAPLAIDETAWFTTRVANNDDSFNGNLRKELWLELKFNDTTGTANSALIGVNGVALVTANIPTQVTDMIYPADLAPATEFGPLSPAGAGQPGPAVYPGSDTSPANTLAIATAFDTLATDPEPANRRRVFPIYTSFGGGNATLEGFIAATVLEVDLVAAGGGNPRLRVKVEPEFYIHPTATTDPDVDENFYVHKLRLTR